MTATREKIFDVRGTVELMLTGAFDPKKLSKEQRRNCVEYLRYGLRMDKTRISRTLRCSRMTVDADLRVIHLALATALTAGGIAEEMVGQLLSMIHLNYQMALDKKDVAGANKSTEALKELLQELGHIEKTPDKVQVGVDILDLIPDDEDDEDEQAR